MSSGEGARSNKHKHIKQSEDDECTISFVRSQNMSTDTLSGQADEADGISSNQNLVHHMSQILNGEQLDEWNVTPASVKVDDETLLNAIESADLGRAIKLLKGDYLFSQYELDRALISACHHGQKYLIQTLVHRGANVQSRDTHGNTPLLICADNGFIDIIRFLLLRKADINAVNSAGDTALILSIKASGSSEIVKFLLTQEGIDVIHQNRDGYTALMKAIEVMDVGTIKMLMDEYSNTKLKWENVFDTQHKVHKINVFDQTVNSNGESEQQIADRCKLGNVFKIFRKYKYKEELPLVMTTWTHDIDSFNILLNCQSLDKKEIMLSVNETLKKIFDNVKKKKVKMFDNVEIVMVKTLLRCGADVDIGWCDGPLLVAVEVGDYSLVKLLCEHLDQQQQHRNGIQSVALKVAATNGRIDLIELLLKYKADINKYSFSDSPLDCALKHGNIECARWLVQIGAKMNIECALETAVNNQMPKYLNFLFDNYKQEIMNCTVKEVGILSNLLASAVEGGNLEIIGHLLTAGADVNHGIVFGETAALRESENGDLTSRGAYINQVARRSAPMLNAVLGRYNYSMAIVRMLLENGASVNGRSWDDNTTLMAAAVNEGSSAMLQILLDRGADFNAQDKLGNTALMKAVLEGCSQNVSCLLQFAQIKKYCLNVQNLNGLTALMWAVTCDDLKLVKELVDHGADVNIKDVNGNTALLRALTHFSRSGENVLLTLISSGSDVNCQNNDGFSPMMIAAINCLNRPISILLDSGADFNAVSKKDNTKSALSFLSHTLHFGREVLLCMNALLERGANSSYISPVFFHNLIIHSEMDVISKLIRCGLGPVGVKPKSVLPNVYNIDVFPTVSPFCMALLVGNVSLAQYFVENLFLTNSDVPSLTSNRDLKCFLKMGKDVECVEFLGKISSQPMLLFQLAFVAVSSAVGSSPGRDNRVTILPLPQVIKDKLLFK